MNRTFPIITLEGLSGTGKTTVGKLLAEKTNGLYFHCKEGNPLEPVRQFFNKTPHMVSFFFYTLYFSFSLKRAKRLAKERIVFMDKSVLWIYSHYKARGLSNFLLSLIPGYLKSGLDAILYFTLEEKSRQIRINKRMKEKKATVNDIESLRIGEMTQKAALEFLPEKLIELVTDNKNPKEVTKLALRKLKAKKII
jgi:thymidylate kinase